jgi:hypothetical protein
MRRLAVPSLLFLSAVLVATCDRARDPSELVDPFAGTGAGQVTGIVRASVRIDGAMPAAGVLITAFTVSDSSVMRSGVTDAQGAVSLAVNAGLQAVVMTVPAGLFPVPGSPVRLDVNAGANETVDVAFALSSSPPPPEARGVTIRGRTGVEGLGPVAGTLLSLRKPGSALNRTSGADGSFDFGTVDGGDWELHFTPPAGYILAHGEQSPRLIAPLVGDSLNVTLDLQIDLATADGAGRVLVQAIADSAALNGVVVRARDAQGQTAGVATTAPGSPPGSALLTLPPGLYQLEVVAPAGYEFVPGQPAAIDRVEVRTGRLSVYAFWFMPAG